MKISTNGPSKNFSTHDNGQGVFTTNAFAMDCAHGVKWGDDGVEDRSEADFIEWDLTNPDQPVLSIKMTKDGGNKSFARAFPCFAKTLFGRYETVGASELPLLPGRRGQGGMDSPKYDLRPVAKVHGYPCKATEVPMTAVYLDGDIPEDMNVNRLIDLYFNFIPGAEGMNDNISPNASRHFCVQIQCGHGSVNREGAHAGGWSGATHLLTDTVGSRRAEIGHKHETHMGNSFPFISIAFEDARAVRVDLVIKWLLENWGKIVTACRAHNCDLFGVTRKSLEKSWIDSPHIGNEVLGYAVGVIKYRRFGIEVGKRAATKVESNTTKPTITDDRSEWTADDHGRIHRHGEVMATDELLEYLNS